MISWSMLHRSLTLGLAAAVLAATALAGATDQSLEADPEVVSAEGEESELDETAVPVVDDVPPESEEDPSEGQEPQEGEGDEEPQQRVAPESTDGVGGGDPDAPVAELEQTTTEPFNMVGVTWASGGADFVVEVSTRQGGQWTEFEKLEVDLGDATEQGRSGTDPMWIDQGADGVSVRILSASGERPEDVKVATIDPGEDGLIEPTAAAVGQPKIISRKSWGAKSASCSGRGSTRGATIHHTAGSNTYTSGQAAGIIRGYQDYHRSRGWCDIGYNFLVDKWGRTYEGRVGGITQMVRGAHAGTNGANTYTVGIAMMGTFSNSHPPLATRAAVADLVAWRFSRAGLPAKGTHVLDGKRVQRIIGHRDVKATECPGRLGYQWVTRNGGLRDSVAKRLKSGSAPAPSYRWKAPTGLKMTSSTASAVTLAWNKVETAKKYVVQISRSSSMSDPTSRAFTSTSGTISGLHPPKAGHTYYVRVMVQHSKDGSALSPWSGAAPAKVTAPPSYRWKAPTGLKASGTSSSSLGLSWNAVSGAKEYVVQVSRSSSMSDPTSKAFTGTSGSISGLRPPKTPYRYYVRVMVRHSKDGSALSPWSAVTSGVTAAAEPSFRWKAPTGLKASGTSSSSLGLSWNAVSGAKEYVVQVSRSSSMSDPTSKAFTGTSGSISGLRPPKTPYRYYVRVMVRHSKDGSALSPWSAVTSGVTAATPTNTVNSRTVGSASSVSFKGHGYGHGIGMSQWGAYGGASKGALASAILKKYYPGTTLADRSRYIRVHLTADNDGSTAVLAQSGLKLLQGSRTVALPTSVSGRKVSHWRIEPYASNRRQSVLRYKSGSTWRTYQSMVWSGSADFAAPTMRLALPGGKTVTYRYKLRAAQPSSTSTVRRTVNVLHLNDYIRGVIPREVPASWPNEALRAQAIAARTYALRSVGSSGWNDLCDTTSCQVYGGASAEHSRTNAAVSSTSNRVLLYQGSPAFTQYSSSSGGYTNKGSQPYLKPVSDPWDNTSANANHSWSQAVKTSTIQSRYPSIGTLRSVKVTKRNGHGSQGGRVVSMQLVGSKKTVTISGTDARWSFGLKSDWFGF